MSELARIEPTTATGEVAELYKQMKKTIGVIPNMAQYMANSPAVLKAWLDLSGALNQGALPAALRERLALSTAEYNRCTYCLSAHTFLAKNVAKIDQAEIDHARDAASDDPHMDAILKLSDAIARGRGAVDKQDLDDARRAGVTDAEITEVIGNIALNTLTNYFNVFTDTPSEYPELVTPRHNH
ncbi:carboxymuconolactone decarboxylase family protein [Streptomyces sp. NPDC048527]|uniref:carboxymuconolactone decarboxylase family protein n=1 Tax=Streptomyces sp. NPDC048527 TaxID=3365568 RepID=UPI0037224F2B